MNSRAVIFDIGGVLVDWQPHLAWTPELGEAETRAFMDRVDFGARNARADGGESFDSLADELPNEADRALLRAYVPNYSRTVQDQVAGTWTLLDRLGDRGVALHAITNWSAETWPEGLKAQPRLGDLFGVTVVSGREGMVKPDRRIFDLLCDRAGLAPADCTFIDDGAHNVAGAKAAGMDGIHFTGAAALETALHERGFL